MLQTMRTRAYVAEAVGTFVIVLFGVGAVHTAVLTGAQAGLWQVAVVWGVAVALAIHLSAAASGAHLNPAITFAMACWRGFAWRRVPAYIASQLVGAVVAAAVLYALWSPVIRNFEVSHGLVRGQPGSELSAMVYGEYFPNPAMARGTSSLQGVSEMQAALAEGLGTAILAFVIMAVTDGRNGSAPQAGLRPWCIGLAVAIIISILAPLSQAGLNPARDFGPRLVAWVAGWGTIAIPGPQGGFFTVYIFSPCLGAVLGAGAYSFLLGARRADAPAAGGPAIEEES
jgi:glycerol uptake facilitator protein